MWGNVGSYSIVMQAPFIQPPPAVVTVNADATEERVSRQPGSHWDLIGPFAGT